MKKATQRGLTLVEVIILAGIGTILAVMVLYTRNSFMAEGDGVGEDFARQWAARAPGRIGAVLSDNADGAERERHQFRKIPGVTPL